METVDVRLLVRGGRPPGEALAQLLTGALRVHAAVELSLNADGALVATPPVHRHVGASRYPEARAWTGRRIGPDGLEVTASSRVARVRFLCGEALESVQVDGIDLARDVLAALNGDDT